MDYINFTILAGSDLDVTDFVNNEIMTAIYSTFFQGSPGITFNTKWSSTSSNVPPTSTRLNTSTNKDYQIETLYPIINKAMTAIFQLPQTLRTKFMDFMKQKIFGLVKPMKPSKN